MIGENFHLTDIIRTYQLTIEEYFQMTDFLKTDNRLSMTDIIKTDTITIGEDFQLTDY